MPFSLSETAINVAQSRFLQGFAPFYYQLFIMCSYDRPKFTQLYPVNFKAGASDTARIRSCEVGRQACDFLGAPFSLLNVWNFDLSLCC